MAHMNGLCWDSYSNIPKFVHFFETYVSGFVTFHSRICVLIGGMILSEQFQLRWDSSKGWFPSAGMTGFP